MLRSLRVRNFRSIRDSKELSLSNLNIIVGPNNSGKSSILYSILLLKQTLLDKDLNATLITSGPYIDLGSYLDIIKADSSSNQIGISFELDATKLGKIRTLSLALKKELSLRPYNRYDLSFYYDIEKNAITLTAFNVSETITKDFYNGIKANGKWQIDGLPKDALPYIRPQFQHFLPMIAPATEKPPDDEKITTQAMDLILSSRMRTAALNVFFENLLYVGPIREKIPRYGFMGTQSYSELSPSGQNLMRVLATRHLQTKERKTLLEQLNYWLDKRFHVLKRVRIENIDKAKTVKSIVADDPRGDQNINLAAMGSGLSQLVPVIVQTVLTAANGCILIEQPEIHLHPAAQASLGDLFVKYAKQKRQLIVETHSEHLLLRVRRRIAEGKLDPELVRVFFVDKQKGETRIRQLSLEANGHFKRWPAGFFEEGYREAMALAMARIGGPS